VHAALFRPASPSHRHVLESCRCFSPYTVHARKLMADERGLFCTYAAHDQLRSRGCWKQSWLHLTALLGCVCMSAAAFTVTEQGGAMRAGK
jgi:hypothetical protein